MQDNVNRDKIGNLTIFKRYGPTDREESAQAHSVPFWEMCFVE